MSLAEAEAEIPDSNLTKTAKRYLEERQSYFFEPAKVAEIAFHPESRVNIPDEVILDQVATNIRRGLPQARPYDINPHSCVIVAGGPSLNIVEKELVETIWRTNAKVVAVNGAYQWCIDHNIRPGAFICMDGRQFNSRFALTPVQDCQYLLSSQCHPDIFEICRGRKVTIWHSLSAGEKELALLDAYYRKIHFPVTLGTTVTLRAISLMRMLGFFSMDIFGLDSCYLEGEHHAFTQAENDAENIMPVWIRPKKGRDDLARRFICSTWQAKQCEDFLELIRDRGNLFRLNVHGDGAIATMIRIGAELAEVVREEQDEKQ